MPKSNVKLIIKTKTYLRCTMTTCQNDHLFSRRMCDVMIARRKLDVYHLTLCLGRWEGVRWVEGQVKSSKGRCYENTTRVVAGGDVGPNVCRRHDAYSLEPVKR